MGPTANQLMRKWPGLSKTAMHVHHNVWWDLSGNPAKGLRTSLWRHFSIVMTPLQVSSGWGILVCGHLNSSVTWGPVVPFKAVALCQAPQIADIWPSCFGHWPSSDDLDTHMAISQSECLAVLKPGLPSFCKHSIWWQHGDRSRVDGNSFPLAFCLMNSMPLFCGRQAPH